MAHDYAQDVKNPLYLEAEERVLHWLRAQGKHVTDRRAEHTFYDFIIGNAWTLDVKCDTRYQETGRVAWEQILVYHDPARLPVNSWGMHPGLNYIAYVLYPGAEEAGPWRVVVCHATRLREAILAHKDIPEVKGFIARGTDRDGTGYAVSLQWLYAQDGVVLQVGVC